MHKVYFSENLENILDTVDFSRLGNKVGIKVHFGEKGCNTFLDPSIAKAIYDRVASLGKQVCLVECNVLYKGSRVNTTEHIKTAREHGFIDMDIDILDGERGDEYIEVDGCKLGKGMKSYDSLIYLSHFKGHMAAGFGAAIKNCGMGLGSRAGKLYMHSSLKPSVADNCIGCGICVENCNAEAISLENGKAQIDLNLCEGCAMCIAVCTSQAINVPWEGRTAEDLQAKIAEYTQAALKILPNSIFINVLHNITKHCDCMGMVQEPIMPDIGFVYSDNIVAVDKASLDIVEKYSNGKFDKINEVNKNRQIESTIKLGLGKEGHEMINR